MPNVQIPIIGPTYDSRSLPISNQVTRNFYIEVDQNSDNIAAFVPFPGLKLFSTLPEANNRGLGVFKNQLYAVNGGNLYFIDFNGAATDLGSIEGAGRCQLEEATSTLVITTGEGKPYIYDGTTLAQGTDADLPDAATVTYIRNRVVYDGNNSDVVFANLGSPLDVNSANITSSDSKPDATLAVKAFRDQVFVFGETSVAPYYNSGAGNPPYTLIQGAFSDVGLKAVYSVASNYRGLYFLGSDLNVYRISGVQPEPIGNPSIGQAIGNYSNIDQAYGVCFSYNNQYFYLLTFPGNASWLFTENAGWTNLAHLQNGEPHLIYDYKFVYGKHVVADRLTSNLYCLDEDTFTDNGALIQRRRDTRKISGKELGFPGKEIYMDRLELVVETGTGLINGQGSNPKIMMSFSDDGGRTWSPEQWAEFGQMGEFTYSQNPTWYDLGSFYERQFRFTVTDPVKTVLISANAEISIGA